MTYDDELFERGGSNSEPENEPSNNESNYRSNESDSNHESISNKSAYNNEPKKVKKN